jgi:hypothetical protein
MGGAGAFIKAANCECPLGPTQALAAMVAIG